MTIFYGTIEWLRQKFRNLVEQSEDKGSIRTVDYGTIAQNGEKFRRFRSLKDDRIAAEAR